MWIDGSLVAKLERDADHKHGKVTMNSSMVKQHKYNLHRSIKMAKHRGAIQWVNTRRMWQGLPTIMDAEEIWSVPESLHSVLQEHHREHTVGLHHSLIRQLHHRKPQGSLEGGTLSRIHQVPQKGQEDNEGSQPPEPWPGLPASNT